MASIGKEAISTENGGLIMIFMRWLHDIDKYGMHPIEINQKDGSCLICGMKKMDEMIEYLNMKHGITSDNINNNSR